MAKKPKRKKSTVRTMERRLISPEDVEKMVMQCAWIGCERTKSMAEPMPPDWKNLILYWSPHPQPSATLLDVCSGPFCDRDAALCGEHAKELDSLLKDIGQALSGPVAGQA